MEYIDNTGWNVLFLNPEKYIQQVIRIQYLNQSLMSDSKTQSVSTTLLFYWWSRNIRNDFPICGSLYNKLSQINNYDNYSSFNVISYILQQWLKK